MDATPRPRTPAAARLRPLALLLAGLLAPGAALASPASDALLAQVPADTAYLFFSDGSLPEPVRRAQSARLVEQLRSARADLDAPAAPLDPKAPTPPARDDALMRSLLDALLGAAERGGGDLPAGMGFGPTDPLSVHADGLLPVLRAHLSQPEGLRAFMGDVMARQPGHWSSRRLGDAEVWTGGDRGSDAHLVVALEGQRLAAGVVPRRGRDAAIRRLLDEAPAEAPFSASPRHDALVGGMGLSTLGLYDLDVAALVAHAAGTPTPAERALFDLDGPMLGQDCAADAERLARAWPGLRGGVVRAEGRSASSVVLLRTAPEIASGVAGLATVAPRWPAEAPLPAMELRVALDIAALTSMIGGQFEEMRARSWTCPALAGLNQLPDQWQQASTGVAIVGVLLKGVWFGMDGVPVLEPGAESLPDAAVAVATTDPAAALSMLQSLGPSLAKLRPTPGGPAVPVEDDSGFAGLSVALGSGGLSAGSGPTWTRWLPALAGPAAGTDDVLAEGRMQRSFMEDVARLQAAEVVAEKGEQPADTERRRREAAAEAASMAELYDALSLRLRAHPDGLLLEQHETFR